jgi:site-specific DNA-methyltransferase (adenine-specific)
LLALPNYTGFGAMFDVIIGNPPYQKVVMLEDGRYGRGGTPIYMGFVEQAIKLNPEYLTMVIPSRWYTDGVGATKFRELMFKGSHISQIVDYVQASYVFPMVDIKGGVCYFLWDIKHSGNTMMQCNDSSGVCSWAGYVDLNEHDVIIRHPQALPILVALKERGFEPMSKYVSVISPFGLPTNPKFTETGIVCYHRYGEVRKVQKYTDDYQLTKKWKVFIPKTACNGMGGNKSPQQIIGKPIVAPPDSVCSGSFIAITDNGINEYFHTKGEAEALASYLRSPFVRFLIGLRKNTQQVTRDKFLFVPYRMNGLLMHQLQPDMDWWAKELGLSQRDVDFINSLVAPMP